MRKAILLIFLIFVSIRLGAHEVDDHLNRVSLSASAESEVENDLLVANLYSEHQSQQQKDVSEYVNKAVAWALGKAKKIDGIKVQTTQYNTSPLYNKRVITGWRARQGIRLESTDSATLSDLIGELQEKLLVGSINYGVSKETRDAAEETLTAEALAQFTKRAKMIAEQLGRDSYQIVQIHVNTQGGHPVPVSYATRGLASAEAKVSAPSLEAGVQSVTVSVNGTIEISQPR